MFKGPNSVTKQFIFSSNINNFFHYIHLHNHETFNYLHCKIITVILKKIYELLLILYLHTHIHHHSFFTCNNSSVIYNNINSFLIYTNTSSHILYLYHYQGEAAIIINISLHQVFVVHKTDVSSPSTPNSPDSTNISSSLSLKILLQLSVDFLSSLLHVGSNLSLVLTI